MATLPPPSEASDLCDATSQVMRDIAYLKYRDASVQSIEAYDAEHGSDLLPDPLLTTHRLTRFYLVGAGDFVYSLGKLLGLPQPMVTSPAVLARSAAEYCSRAAYLADDGDLALTRTAKMYNVYREAFNDLGVNKPGADRELVKMSNGFNVWKNNHSVPKTPLPNYTDLIRNLAPEIGQREYQNLSGVAHANAISLTGAVISAQQDDGFNNDNRWRYALFATHCGVMAAAKVAVLRGADLTPVFSCRRAYEHYETLYNRYLWDLSKERGFNPSEPRP